MLAGKYRYIVHTDVDAILFSESYSEQGDSGEDRLDSATRKTITDTIYNTLCQDDVPVMEGEGAREKRFNDGRVEVWYSNGNR